MAEVKNQVEEDGISKDDMPEACEQAAKLILEIDKALDEKKPVKRLVNEAEKLLSDVDDSEDFNFHKYGYIFFELRAFICLANGLDDELVDELNAARNVKPSDMMFVSDSARKWELKSSESS